MTDKTFFFILANQRSGSTWLQKTLDLHDQVTCLFEPSNLYKREKTLLQLCHNLMSRPMQLPKKGDITSIKSPLLDKFPVTFNYPLQTLRQQMEKSDTPYVGAKIIWHQLLSDYHCNDFFLRYRDVPMIIVDRKPYIDGMCSWHLASKTHKWHTSESPHDHIAPFVINTDWARDYLSHVVLYDELIKTYLHRLNIKHLHITYDHISESKIDTLQKIADFLGINAFTQESDLIKMVTTPYANLVLNYDELRQIETDIIAQQK